jgi:WD40 repeat protein
MIRRVVFSPDGKTIATGGDHDDPTVRLWEVKTGTEIWRGVGHDQAIESLSFSRSGKVLASGCNRRLIFLWDVATGKQLRCLKGHRTNVQGLTFSHEEEQLVSVGSDGRVLIWNFVEGDKPEIFAQGKAGLRTVAFSAAGDLLFVGGDEQILVWKWPSRTFLFEKTFDNFVEKLAAPAATKGVFVGAIDQAPALLDVVTKETVFPLGECVGPSQRFAISADGSTAAFAGSKGPVEVWSLSPPSRLVTDPILCGLVFDLAISPNGTVLAIAGGSVLQLHRLPCGGRLFAEDTHLGRVKAVAFSPNGSLVASGGLDRSTRIWDIAGGRLRTTLSTLQDPKDFVTGLAWSPDGRDLASGSHYGPIKIWDVANGRERSTISEGNPHGYQPTFSPDGRFLADQGAGNSIGLWDVSSGRRERTLRRVAFKITSLTFHPTKSHLLAAADLRDTIKVWDVNREEVVLSLGGRVGSRTLGFTSEGHLLDGQKECGTIAVYSLDSPPSIFREHAVGGKATALAFSSDGKLAAVGDEKCNLFLLDMSSGCRVATAASHQGPITALSFSPDGKRLASGGSDGRVMIWNVHTLFDCKTDRLP